MNLQEAADHIGVHYQTAYRWVRGGELVARKTGRSYEITADEVHRFKELRSTPTDPPAQLRIRSWESLRVRLIDALLEGDELVARHTTSRLFDGGVSAVDICDTLIAPALNEIGALWHQGRESVAVEHRATEICSRILASLYSHHRGRPRGIAIVLGAPGDAHAMPATMAAIALREDHWQVHHLGPHVPVGGVIDLARKVGAHLVIISSTFGEQTELQAFAEHLRAEHFLVFIGGIDGTTLRELVALARGCRNTVTGT